MSVGDFMNNISFLGPEQRAQTYTETLASIKMKDVNVSALCQIVVFSPLLVFLEHCPESSRGDIEYWTIYAVLGEAVQLISYPYYTKMAKPGTRTQLKHIDLNIEECCSPWRRAP
ncbi:hypothetical protein K504DRAFT_500042 [Pleomassaria siparia CBS 279.74]|uniref:Uncharacterized protein n=1 Tax=Pleomassaria siparia CBS 279.74 TaxID=1314801 RepID=A0A6G1KFG7_9PLEO|nr:hypothetical protein K504DRAFT_500042 [Pleomassaria siparia CBS 279.74]